MELSSIFTILKKIAENRPLSDGELNEAKRLFHDKTSRETVDQWILSNWDLAGYDDIEIGYDKLKEKIQQYERQQKVGYAVYRRVVNLSGYYQRIAAVLFIPLVLGIAVYLYNSPQENFYTAEAPLGQKAKVELPDGSTVWLNAGSTIRYSSDFNRKNRNIELQGEAYFEVEKNSGKPFYVRTDYVDIEVTGTQFNVDAYRDEPVVETSLVEGHVNLFIKGKHDKYELSPGNVLSYSKDSQTMTARNLDEDAATGWRYNRLIFINDDFSKLARKIEKWYDIEVEYDSNEFKDNKLTVKLLQGERLGKLLEIIESAVGANCTVKGDTIYITKI